MSPPGPRDDAVSGAKNEELFKSQCKVAKSFLELFKLLEEYAPSWYTFEHRNRAATAKLLLDSSGLLTASDSAGEQAGPDHLELHYACKILYLAVRSAIGSESPLHERLLDCFLELSFLDLRRRLPADLGQCFDNMMNTLSCAEDPSGRMRAIAVTIEKMHEQEVRAWLDEILILLIDANRRHARAEGP